MQRLLIDTNILVLLVVGTWDRSQIRSHRRTQNFTPDDFDTLQEEMLRFQNPCITTSSILAETSNLMGNEFHEEIADVLLQVCRPLIEITRPKEDLFAIPAFPALGFTDCSVLAALNEEIVVLTDDFLLYGQVWEAGFEAINFNHLRKPRK